MGQRDLKRTSLGFGLVVFHFELQLFSCLASQSMRQVTLIALVTNIYLTKFSQESENASACW